MQAEEMMDRRSGGRSSVRLIRARRMIRAVALSLVIGGFGTTAALADVCQYSDGRQTPGPCMQFENHGNKNNFDLRCWQGPTSTSHKIVLNNGDSFTCEVSANLINYLAAKTRYNNHHRFWNFDCEVGEKHIVKLIKAGTHGHDGTWEEECRPLQSSLRY